METTNKLSKKKFYLVCIKTPVLISGVQYYQVCRIFSEMSAAKHQISRQKDKCLLVIDHELNSAQREIYFVTIYDVYDNPGHIYTLFDSFCNSVQEAVEYIQNLPEEIRKYAFFSAETID